MDAETIATINASRARLKQFIDTATDDQLAQIIDDEWSVAAHLSHLAFFDRRAAFLLRRVLDGDLAPSPLDPDSINVPAIHQWRLIPPRAAAQEALAAADEVDNLATALTPDLLTAMQDANTGIRYNRGTHRNAHLDQIARALDQTP